ncbi:MAG: hypothetical protein AAB074_17080 [Planctomycetota bacterium]
MQNLRSFAVLLAMSFAALFPSAAVAQEDEGWEFVRALALLQQTGPFNRTDGAAAAARALPEPDAEAARAHVENLVALVPYAGSFVEPADVREGTSVNTLDRARFLAAVLAAMKLEARIMVADAAKGAKVAWPEKGAAVPVSVPEPICESVRKSIAEVLPPLWEQVKKNAAAWASGTGSFAGPDVCWVQVKEGAGWKDLAFADTVVPEAAKAAAVVLSADELQKRMWSVSFRATVHRGAAEELALAFTAPAGRLHGVAVTYLHMPVTLASFVPFLLVGSDVHKGTAFEAKTAKGVIDQVRVVVELKGPHEARAWERQLVSFPAALPEFDRGLGLALLARLTVTTGRFDDPDRIAMTESVFAPIARALVTPPRDPKIVKPAEGGDFPKDAMPFNIASLRAIALVEAAHELSTLATAGIAGTRAHRARPSIVLEHESMRVAGEKMFRFRGLDVLEPGGAVSGPADACGRAALAWSIAWARAEDAVALGENVTTSWEAVSRLFAAKKAFSPDPPAGGSDKVDGKSALYVTALDGTSARFGLRLSPGPSAVWILSDGSGGVWSTGTPEERVRDLCGKLKWGSYLLPLQVMPYAWLVGPIVGYHCKLAEAYNAAAGALDNLFGPPKDDNAEKRKDLESHLRGLGPGLLGDLAESAVLNGIAHGLLAPVFREVGSSVVAPLLGWVNRAGGNLIPRVASGGSRVASETVAAATARESTAAAAAASESMLKAGMKSEEAAAALGAESRAAAEAAAKRAAAGESGEVVLRDITEAALKREAAAGKTLDAALAKYYQGKPMPPMHVTDTAGLRSIAGSGRLDGPTSGASFGHGGVVGSVRRGGQAVRVRPEAMGRSVDFIKEGTGAGKIPQYWPNGVGNGKPSGDLPVEVLEYFNVQGGKWMPIPRGG